MDPRRNPSLGPTVPRRRHPHLPLPHRPPLPQPFPPSHPPTDLPQTPHRPPLPHPSPPLLRHVPRRPPLSPLPPPRRLLSPRHPSHRPLFFWAHVFYLSKFLEFGDTALILLGKSIRRLTFLHVYHHSMVVVMCYLWLETSQSLFPVALVTNAGVHVVMYGYYMLCAVGLKPRWKRLVTDCQIVQFVFSFGISGLMLYYHFGGGGCSGMWAWVFNAGFNGSLLVLFVDFHGRSYGGGGDMTKKKMKIGGGDDDKVKRP